MEEYLNLLVDDIQQISEFKELIESLDDCLFVDMLEEIESYGVNLKKFDEYLNKEELDGFEMFMLMSWIILTRYIVKDMIETRIETLMDIHKRL